MVSALLLMAVAGGLGAPRTSPPHPVHAARVEVIANRDGRVSAVVQVHREDFPPGEHRELVIPYLTRGIALTNANGERVLFQLDSMTREGDRLRIALHGESRTPLSRGHLDVTLLQEKFNDQVNVAKVDLAGRAVELVFVKGDAPQVLP